MDLQALGFHQIFGNEGLYLNTSWNKRKKVGRNVLKEKRIKTWRIITGDLVEVTQGLHKGKRGKVLKVFRKKDRLLVQGINVRKRHPRIGTNLEGYYFTEAPISYSNVALIDPIHDKPCKVGFKYLENNEKVRISRLRLQDGTSSGAIIPKPKKDLSKLEEKRKNNWTKRHNSRYCFKENIWWGYP